MSAAYIVAATRTAGGRKGGRLAGWHPADLAGQVLDNLIDRTGADPALIEDVVMGCVSQVGEQSINVARGAILASRLPESVPGTSVDRQCGSSQQALQFAAQAIMSGTQDIVIAAGVESMTRVPMGLSAALPAQNGFGVPMSPEQQKRYPNIQFSQFMGAEMMAAKYGLSRDQLDEFGYGSHQRAIAATQAGAFKDEIVPIAVKDAEGGESLHSADEGIRYDVSLEGMRGVKLLREGGRITAEAPSQIWLELAAVIRPPSRSSFTPLIASSEASKRMPSSTVWSLSFPSASLILIGVISPLNAPPWVAAIAFWWLL